MGVKQTQQLIKRAKKALSYEHDKRCRVVYHDRYPSTPAAEPAKRQTACRESCK